MLPKFSYTEGMHLDVGRHMFSVEFIKEGILMPWPCLKMNTFHWHLTEDQGWRIEIKKYPESLQEVAALQKGNACRPLQ
jgi:hexosaminidase